MSGTASGLVVVDLDGTLIPGNSFHAWMRFLGRWAVLSARLPVVVRLAVLCLQRACGSLTHGELKHAVLLLSAAVPATRVDEFSRRLARSVRTEVQDLVRAAADDGHLVVLATAAPAFYLEFVTKAIGADVTIGTPSPGMVPWRESTGEGKLARVLDELGAESSIVLVVTDHRDDLPLVTRAQRAVIVNPSSESWAAFARSGVPVERLEVSP